MNGGDDNPDDETATKGSSSSRSKKNDTKLRSVRRKRRRTHDTTGLMSPANVKKTKRARKTTSDELTNEAVPDAKPSMNGDEKQPSIGINKDNNLLLSNDTGSDRIGEADSFVNPALSASIPENRAVVPDQEQNSAASLNVALNGHHSQESSSSPDKEKSQEIDVVPPKYVHHANGKSANDSTIMVSKNSTALVLEQRVVETTETDQSEIQNEEVETKENTNEILAEESKDSSSTPTWGSTFQRFAIFVVLGYVSLLFTLPLVVNFAQFVVPFDDSILPPLPKPPTIEYTVEPVYREEVQDEEEEEDEDEKEEALKLEAALEQLQSWNEDFSRTLEQLTVGKNIYKSSAQDLENYYRELLDRFEKTGTQIQIRKKLLEKKLSNLGELEELLQANDNFEYEDAGELGEARDLAEQLLGKILLTTSFIEIWNVSEELDMPCHLGLLGSEYDEDENFVEEIENEDEAPPFLLARHLEATESDLNLRSTITAERFIGGAVAEERIRKWVKSKITEAINDEEDATQVIEEIEDFVRQLSEVPMKALSGNELSQEELYQGHMKVVSDIIQSQLETHRADTTGIYDSASLKNGAEIIYGGKRGTSKSLIDELPVLNRILQNSKLRFYGFGPEAALTATYPPNTLGQCWSFRQTPLKDQLKERELFENDDSVPNDFKRGNFGTMTIRLSEPTQVYSIIIEHPPFHMTEQAESSIRSFRVVGYEDEMASSKSWNLGSFEYSLKENMENNAYLQEFETATTVFGKAIPPLNAISLAIDSNYGHEYACLYRFRVHGTEEQ